MLQLEGFFFFFFLKYIQEKLQTIEINTNLTTEKPKLGRQREPPSTERKQKRLKLLANVANESHNAL
jgi:hypothetical protein